MSLYARLFCEAEDERVTPPDRKAEPKTSRRTLRSIGKLKQMRAEKARKRSPWRMGGKVMAIRDIAAHVPEMHLPGARLNKPPGFFMRDARLLARHPSEIEVAKQRKLIHKPEDEDRAVKNFMKYNTLKMRSEKAPRVPIHFKSDEWAMYKKMHGLPKNMRMPPGF